MNADALVKLLKDAANDESLTDREVRDLVRFLSMAPIDERDIARTYELAARYGWAAFFVDLKRGATS